MLWSDFSQNQIQLLLVVGLMYLVHHLSQYSCRKSLAYATQHNDCEEINGDRSTFIFIGCTINDFISSEVNSSTNGKHRSSSQFSRIESVCFHLFTATSISIHSATCKDFQTKHTSDRKSISSSLRSEEEEYERDVLPWIARGQYVGAQRLRRSSTFSSTI